LYAPIVLGAQRYNLSSHSTKFFRKFFKIIFNQLFLKSLPQVPYLFSLKPSVLNGPQRYKQPNLTTKFLLNFFKKIFGHFVSLVSVTTLSIKAAAKVQSAHPNHQTILHFF
jgi:hypothetical protein